MIGEDDYDMIFKIVLTGDSGVGKSNILSRYIKNEFNLDTKSTVGVEFGAKRLKLKGMNIKAQIWDTAGQERYKSITNAYYKGSKGAIIVFDISRRDTFSNVDRWISELKNNAESDASVLLVGNKCDLEHQREVSKEEAKAKSEEYGMAYMETSAMHSINIEKAFEHLIEGNFFIIEEINKKFNKYISEHDEDVKASNVIDLNTVSKKNNEQAKKGGCCQGKSEP